MKQEERIKLARAIWEIARDLDEPGIRDRSQIIQRDRTSSKELRAIAGDISGSPGWPKWEPENQAENPDPESDEPIRKRYWDRRREFERGIDRCLEHTGGPWVAAIRLVARFLVLVHVEVSVLRSRVRRQNHSLVRQLTAIRENVAQNASLIAEEIRTRSSETAEHHRRICAAEKIVGDDHYALADRLAKVEHFAKDLRTDFDSHCRKQSLDGLRGQS